MSQHRLHYSSAPRHHRWRPALAALTGLALLTAACAPATAPPQPTSPPAAQSAAKPAAAPAAQPTVAVAKPAATAQPAAAAQSAPTRVPAQPPVAAPAGSTRFTLVPTETEARFIARELLAGETIKSDAIGVTKEVTGQIVLGPQGQIVDGSRVTVNVQSLKTDVGMRDNFIKRNTLQTDQFPEATFVPREVQGLSSLPTSGQATFKLLGDLTVHGVTQPVTWDVNATFSPQNVTGRAKTAVQLEDFGMQKPQVPRVASIEDIIRLEIDFSAARAA